MLSAGRRDEPLPCPRPDDEVVTVTRRELAELRRDALTFRYLAQKSPLPVVLTSRSTSEILFTNQEAEAVFGDGLATGGKVALGLYENPADRELLMAEVRATGVARNFPMRLRRADGSVGDFLMSMAPTEVDGLDVLYTYVLDVSERAAAERALRMRTAEMGLILDNVSEGLLMVRGDGTVSGEHSAVVERWLGALRPGETFADALARANPRDGAWFAMCWESVTDGVLPLELALEQLPRVLLLAGRHIELHVRPIGAWSDDARPEQYLVILSDISDAIARERAEAEQRQLMAIFSRLQRDRTGVVEFLAEADALVARIVATPISEATITTFRRDVHTLKGNCAQFGVQAVASACHALETAIDEGGLSAASPTAVAAITSTWEAFARQAREFISSERDDLEVSPEDYASLRGAIAAGASTATLLAMLDSWQHEPVKRRLQRISAQATALARRLGRGDIAFEIEDRGARLPSQRWAPFWAVFGHAIRNAIDHGLEDCAERIALGKPASGRLRVAVEERPDAVCVTLSDDGRGIDWQRIRARAERLGLPAETDAELQRALFADGVTTREVVSEVSGRGIGTAALLACVEQLGGSIAVESIRGAGTTFVFEIPGRC
ncbi:MAG: Hpt domain-containing protein [Deltaproteobacteria bacterium]|nr:Hpt domain-containing protein [Deltaproteobacteria bacterium]